MKCCGIKNVNGNMLDQMVLEEIKKISVDWSEFQKQLCRSKKAVEESKEEAEWDISRLKDELKNMEGEINGLAASLRKAGGTGAEGYIIQQIEGLHKRKGEMERRLWELSLNTENKELSDTELQFIKQTLSSFQNVIGLMDVRQRRAAVRTFVDKVIWDGENVHLYLFGSKVPELPEPQGDSSK